MTDQFSPGAGNEDPDFGLPEVSLDPIERGGTRKRGGAVHAGKGHTQRQTRNNNTPLIVSLVLVLIIAMAAIWYFFGQDLFSSQADADNPLIENTPINNDQSNNQELNTSFDTLGSVSDVGNFDDDDEVVDPVDDSELLSNGSEDELSTQSTGSFETVQGRTGRTYVIIGSFIDEDLAKDHADILSRQGTSTKLLYPTSNVRYYRLSIADYGSVSEAASALGNMRNNYNNPDLWIIKH